MGHANGGEKSGRLPMMDESGRRNSQGYLSPHQSLSAGTSPRVRSKREVLKHMAPSLQGELCCHLNLNKPPIPFSFSRLWVSPLGLTSENQALFSIPSSIPIALQGSVQGGRQPSPSSEQPSPAPVAEGKADPLLPRKTLFSPLCK